MTGPRAVGIYARISQDRDGMTLGVQRQEDDCRAVLERKGWPFGGLYVDNDISAYSGKPRPDYKRMLEDVRLGVIDGVVAYDLDRLHRQPIELEEFFKVMDGAGVTHLATASGDVDLANEDDRFKARARTASAEEKPAMWQTMVAEWPAYDEYQRNTKCEIRVVVLERA